MANYKTEYSDYSKHVAIMISTDRLLFLEKSNVRLRMIEYAKLYKELHIIVFSGKGISPFQITENCKVYSTNSYVRWNYVADAIKIGKKILKGIERDIPLLVTCQDPFETALAGKNVANLRKNSELLIQIHTELFNPNFAAHSFLNKIRLFISTFTLPHAQTIRVVSNNIADSLVRVKGIAEEKIIVKSISVDVEYIRTAIPTFYLHKKYPQFKKIILTVSRLESEKNVTQALDILTNTSSDTGLIIVGSGKEMNRLKKYAHHKKIMDRVIFVGWQTDLVPYYKGCDIFLVTSLYEGYGMVFKEAQAAGCRIISTDVGIAREVGAEIINWNTQTIQL